MKTNVEHAVIMAAGIASRLAPLSHERPKALLDVRGEILIERQIRQLIEAGVPHIVVVTGYKAGMFDYLTSSFPVTLIHNPEYATRNNNGSLYAARDYLQNAYICSADNYFTENPFERAVDAAYYAVVYAEGKTDEWCVQTDSDGIIRDVRIGGENSWYMLGHVFFDKAFADTFRTILVDHYDDPSYKDLLWEAIYLRHIASMQLRKREYDRDVIVEFDTLDDLRAFDESYVDNTRSRHVRQAAAALGCRERDITGTAPLFAADGSVAGFSFRLDGNPHTFLYPR